MSFFERVRAKKSKILEILGYSLAILSLVWVLHDFHIVKSLRQMANVDWSWVLVGMTFDVISYLVQALRWKFLLAPFGRVRLTRTTRAVFAGLFANLVFPLRPGEFLRSYLISSQEDITLGRVLGSVGVERLIDLVIATASLGVVSLFVELPQRFKRAADILGVVTLAVVATIVALILYLEFKMGAAQEVSAKKSHIPGKIMSALTGLHAMGTAPSFYPAVLTSIAMPVFQVLALWAMVRSYGLGLSFMACVVVLLVINLGVSLPNAPANVGSYQFFCVLGVSIFGVEKTTAAGFSFFAWFALTVPFIFLGFAALVRSGMTIRSMRERVSGISRRPSGANAAS
ncbi:MAG TPA: lysylphosphatidylglycerol synthase transmembrane domain-containing protein [Candidatus Acidoferrales bacterium]|nr:lysylphosphatidylglycerol synthase transmembrane domain-containing protein [Candidatus Acidoferrales bacterium]